MMGWLNSKYGNQKTEIDGIRFDSKREAERWAELRLLEKAGLITDLERQKQFEVIPKTNKYRAAYYVADFVYKTNGQTIVEDSKGMKTQVYLLKKKLMYARYGIEIREV